MLLEKYLLEYRSAAYEVHHSKQTKNQGGEGEKGGIDGQSRTIVVADGEWLNNNIEYGESVDAWWFCRV